MKYEVEQKFRVADLPAFIRRLEAIGAELGDPVEQVDSYFNHPNRDFAETDESLRIRRVGQRNRVTYKGPRIDRATKTRREIELPVGDGSETAQLLDDMLCALSFQVVRDVRKSRRTASLAWQQGTIEVALDDVLGLGTFVELEIVAGASELDDARDRVASLAAKLELSDSERRSYLELLIESERPAGGR